MKKLTLTISIALLSGFSAISQIPKGTKYIGGSLGFNSTKKEVATLEDSKTTSWNINPEFGYFIKENLSVGLVFRVANEKTTDNLLATGEKSDKSIGTNLGFGLYARKFFNVSDNFNLFAGLTFMNTGYSNSHKVEYTAGGEKKIDNWGSENTVSLSGGMAYSLSKKWTLVGTWAPGFGMSSKTINSETTIAGVKTTAPKETEKSTGFNINTFGNPFTVGVYYSF